MTFVPGSANGTLECLPMLAIIDDDALEGDQSFTLTLTTFDPNVVIQGNMTAITITDNDGTDIMIVIRTMDVRIHWHIFAGDL